MKPTDITSTLASAEKLLKQKEYTRAAFSYCEVLSENPRHAPSLHNLGAIFILGKRPLDALPVLMTASQLKPNNPDYAIAFARSLIELGEGARARAYLEHNPALMSTAKIQSALAQLPIYNNNRQSFEGFITQMTQAVANRRVKKAVTLFNSANYEDAYKEAFGLIWSAPNTPAVWKTLSGAAMHLKKMEFAETCARRALALQPDNAEAWSNLLLIVRQQHRQSEIANLLEKASIRSNWDARIALQAVEVYDADGHPEKAISLLDRYAQNTSEDNVNVMTVHAQLLDRMGRTEEAQQIFERALALEPMNKDVIATAAAFYDRFTDPSLLSNLLQSAHERGVEFDRGDLVDAEARSLLRLKDYDAALDTITRALSMAGSTSQYKGRHFTLGKVYDKLGRFEEAFEAFQKANLLLEEQAAQERRYDHTNSTRRIMALRDRLQAEKDGSQPARLASADQSGPKVAFIVGFPRSGTTLLDTILRSHSKVEVIEEKGMLNEAIRKLIGGFISTDGHNPERIFSELDKYDINDLRSLYLENLKIEAGEELDPSKVYIDKLPLNMNWAPVLHSIFPESLFILAIRHPFDVAVSNFFQDFRPNNAMLNMTRLSRINDFYDASFNHWEEFVELRSPNTIRVTYEDVLNDLENTVSRAMERLGLKWEEAQERYFETAMERKRINTPSYTQVTQKIYTDSKNRWLNYKFAFGGQDTNELNNWAVKHGYAIN